VSEAVDDYLKAIYALAGDDGRATTASIAEKLSVAPASVTGMLRKLSEQSPAWVDYEKHRGATLTDDGRRRALEVIRHHRLIELFLHETLGYRWDEVHAEAERLEHAISEQFEDRIAAALGDPEVDPHGHPIPRKDGTIPERSDRRLLDLEAGTTGVVSRVSDRDPALLRYFTTLGVKPGARLEVVERGPFDDLVMVRIDGSDEVRALGVRVCREIRVADADLSGAVEE
jgi:DtxR family transcriptional regulator, Mn-dependent transcriptional regulator